MLVLYLAAVIFLAEKFAVPLDNSIEQFHMPQAFGGAIIAALVLSPEGLGGITASLHNQLQRSINILFGSVLATIGLTIPAVLMIGLLTKQSVALGVQGGNLPLLLLTLAVSVVTFTSRKTNVLQGCIHLLLFAVFVLLIFVALKNERSRQPTRDLLCRSVHHDSVGPLFNDLESKSLVETQHRFPSYEADRDRRVIGICADQLRQQSRADAMPAVLRFHR